MSATYGHINTDMRCPSEPFCLRWEWFNWSEGIVTFDAPKTGWRTTPLFPELRPYLDTVWDAAKPGDELVFEDWKVTGGAITNRLRKILRRLEISAWPKPWQNMQATRETELTERFPEHVVCAWLGNFPKTAREHYLRVTKEHLSRALDASTIPHTNKQEGKTDPN